MDGSTVGVYTIYTAKSPWSNGIYGIDVASPRAFSGEKEY
jgi:hypothetical protein